MVKELVEIIEEKSADLVSLLVSVLTLDYPVVQLLVLRVNDVEECVGFEITYGRFKTKQVWSKVCSIHNGNTIRLIQIELANQLGRKDLFAFFSCQGGYQLPVLKCGECGFPSLTMA
jgi:hypothetical protein